MDVQSYVGRLLSDLVKDTPDYAINFFSVRIINKGNYYPEHAQDGALRKHEIRPLRELLDNEQVLDLRIKDIKMWQDWDYWITLDYN